MNCLVCGHKLAIFRRLSLGDFCCQEHRTLFLQQQAGDGGSSRTLNGNKGTRVYARFLSEGLAPVPDSPELLGFGPLAAEPVAAPAHAFALAAILHTAAPAMETGPASGRALARSYGFARTRPKLPRSAQPISRAGASRLRPAGLILPWSAGAGSQFSLAPLVAAAWAQSGSPRPIVDYSIRRNSLAFAWPAVTAGLELPECLSRTSAAPFAPMAAPAMRGMRVRLSTPSVARREPKIELPAPEPAPLDIEEPVPAPVAPPSFTTPPKRKTGLLASLFSFRYNQRIPERRSRRLFDGDEVFTYDEPAPLVDAANRSNWQNLLARLTPSAAAASGVFAVLFLFSALAIFFSAPSTLAQRTPSWRWGHLREAIRSRAVLRVEDDFREGLNRWIGPSGWSRDWSYDQAGFLRPGRIGFLEQSMKLTDYRLEFMGQIERKSLGWAFRAKDDRNYQVAKLMIARPGPLPMVDLVHYTVTNGREGPKSKVPLPFSVRNDTLYQVEMNVRGDQFRATVNGRVVGSWSDKRLLAGGVGFVSDRGEAARVRWIRVSDKDDLLGRICSYLTARAYTTPDGLSASYYSFFLPPGNPADF